MENQFETFHDIVSLLAALRAIWAYQLVKPQMTHKISQLQIRLSKELKEKTCWERFTFRLIVWEPSNKLHSTDGKQMQCDKMCNTYTVVNAALEFFYLRDEENSSSWNCHAVSYILCHFSSVNPKKHYDAALSLYEGFCPSFSCTSKRSQSTTWQLRFILTNWETAYVAFILGVPQRVFWVQLRPKYLVRRRSP